VLQIAEFDRKSVRIFMLSRHTVRKGYAECLSHTSIKVGGKFISEKKCPILKGSLVSSIKYTARDRLVVAFINLKGYFLLSRFAC
jgi:hypothetical protein